MAQQAEHTEPLTHTTGAHPLDTLPTISERDVNGVQRDGYTQSTASLRTAQSVGASGASKLIGVRTALGLHAQAPVDEEHDLQEHHQLLWPRIRLALREPFAEFWGVFIMVAFGNGSVAQVLLSEKQNTAPGGDGFGQYQSISWGFVHPSSTTVPLAKRH